MWSPLPESLFLPVIHSTKPCPTVVPSTHGTERGLSLRNTRAPESLFGTALCWNTHSPFPLGLKYSSPCPLPPLVGVLRFLQDLVVVALSRHLFSSIHHLLTLARTNSYQVLCASCSFPPRHSPRLQGLCHCVKDTCPPTRTRALCHHMDKK